MSDALHGLGDCMSLAITWFLQKKSAKRRDRIYSYGYKRFSLLGSIFLYGVLTVSSVFVLTEAIKRVASPQEVSAQGMLWLAIFGIVINGAAAFRVKHGTTLNERAVYLHIVEDVLGWAGVLAVSVVMMFWDVPILDPILSITISCWVLYNVYKNLRVVFRVLLQAVPDNISMDELNMQLMTVTGVLSVHDLHIWSLDGESHVMTLHVVTLEECNACIKNDILTVVKHFSITHLTIEFETPDMVCVTNCAVKGQGVNVKFVG